MWFDFERNQRLIDSFFRQMSGDPFRDIASYATAPIMNAAAEALAYRETQAGIALRAMTPLALPISEIQTPLSQIAKSALFDVEKRNADILRSFTTSLTTSAFTQPNFTNLGFAYGEWSPLFRYRDRPPTTTPRREEARASRQAAARTLFQAFATDSTLKETVFASGVEIGKDGDLKVDLPTHAESVVEVVIAQEEILEEDDSTVRIALHREWSVGIVSTLAIRLHAQPYDPMAPKLIRIVRTSEFCDHLLERIKRSKSAQSVSDRLASAIRNHRAGDFVGSCTILASVVRTLLSTFLREAGLGDRPLGSPLLDARAQIAPALFDFITLSLVPTFRSAEDGEPLTLPNEQTSTAMILAVRGLVQSFDELATLRQLGAV